MIRLQLFIRGQNDKNMQKQQNKTHTAMVSVHDVMPTTLDRVREIVRFLRERRINRFTLLVVPGSGWSAGQIARLKTWQEEGIELAGHGWQHRGGRRRSFWHKIHGRMISRQEAEHLSLEADEIADIIRCCYRWFAAAGLIPPTLYVPPAWALGKIPEKHLPPLPFALYETISGIYEVGSGQRLRLPLAGYMADTPLRAMFLKINNAANMALPLGPKRIAVHPDDLKLRRFSDLCP